MTVQDIPRTEGDRASQSLIGAAAAALALREPGIPKDFLAELFGLAVPEDLQRYGPEELASIAEQSWAFFARAQGRCAQSAPRARRHDARRIGARYRQ